MAIALDSVNAGSNQTGTALSFNHTCSGTNRILFVGIEIVPANTNDLTTVTYNSVGMTLVGSIIQPVNNRWHYLYYIIAPSTGTHSITVNSTSSTQKVMNAVSYVGARQIGVPDASTTNSNTNNNIAGTVTTVANNCWLTGIVGAVGTGLAAGAGTTLRGTVSSFDKMMDSNGAVAAGSNSLNATTSGGTSGFCVVVASFAPYLSPTMTGISSTTGLSTITF